MQLKFIFILKEIPALVFPRQLSEIFSNNFFKGRKIALLWEKKHCYKKRGTDIYRKSNYEIFYVTSPRFMYSSKALAQFIVTTGYKVICSFISQNKLLEVVNNTLTIGFWRSLTCQISHVDINPFGRLNIYALLPQNDSFFEYFWRSRICFIRYCNNPTEITRKHFCDVYSKNQKYLREMFLRRLREVTEKTSFLRCIWDVLKTSQKRHLFWDVSERSLRYISQWRSDWDLSETSHAGWV